MKHRLETAIPMDSKRILQLLAKQMGQAASEEETAELNELLANHPDKHFLIEILQSIEGEKQHAEPAIGENELVQKGWKLLQEGLKQNNTDGETQSLVFPQIEPAGKLFILRGRLLRVAMWVGIIVLAGSSFFILGRHKRSAISLAKVSMKQISLPYGAPEKKILPDGSIVWLNAGTHISYTQNFTQDRREVFLDGEAYFDVKHDAGHPFVVHAGNIEIEVLGTEFNVQAYPDENKIETTLIAGKIQVQIAGKPDKKVVLTPNEKLTVVNGAFSLSGHIEKRKELSFQVKEVVPAQTTTPIPEIAWLQDKLAFQDEAFQDLAKQLDRRYNVHILFKDTLLEQERLSGVFVNENIQKAIKILQMTTPFDYKIVGDTVYLNGNNKAKG